MNLDQVSIKREAAWFTVWSSGAFNYSTFCYTPNTGSYIGNGAPYYCNGFDNDEIPMGFATSGNWNPTTMKNPETWIVGSNDISSWPSGTTAYGILYSSGLTTTPVTVLGDSYHVQVVKFQDNMLYFMGPASVNGAVVSAFYRYTGNPRAAFTRPAPLAVSSDFTWIDFDMLDADTAFVTSTGALVKLYNDPANPGTWATTSYTSSGITFLQVRDSIHTHCTFQLLCYRNLELIHLFLGCFFLLFLAICSPWRSVRTSPRCTSPPPCPSLPSHPACMPSTSSPPRGTTTDRPSCWRLPTMRTGG